MYIYININTYIHVHIHTVMRNMFLGKKSFKSKRKFKNIEISGLQKSVLKFTRLKGPIKKITPITVSNINK